MQPENSGQPYINYDYNYSPPPTPFKMPYIIPYISLLVFNGLLFLVNIFYDHLNSGLWYPYPLFTFQPQLLKQRPYEIIVYVLNSLSTLIFLIYLLMPGQENSNHTEKKMIARWFLHVLAFSIIFIIWMLDIGQIWVYKYTLKDFAGNDNWSDPFYTILYAAAIAYGVIIAFPMCIYLTYRYFIKAQDNYKMNPQPVEYHRNFNRLCYFATFISIIIILSLNLTYLNDYEDYLVATIYPKYPYANYQTQMLLPVMYLQYIFSGLTMVFAVFLMIKQIFDTMKNKRKHIRRQLIVLTSAMITITVLAINKFIEVNRYDKIVKITTFPPNQPFLQLYYHLRVIMWCYIFLLYPLCIYSIRNLWRQWKNQFTAGDLSQINGSKLLKVNEEPLYAGQPNKQLYYPPPLQPYSHQQQPQQPQQYRPPEQLYRNSQQNQKSYPQSRQNLKASIKSQPKGKQENIEKVAQRVQQQIKSQE